MQDLAVPKQTTYANILRKNLSKPVFFRKNLSKKDIPRHSYKQRYKPFWYQKKYLNSKCKLKNVKIHFSKLLLNKDICIKARDIKYRCLKRDYNEIITYGIHSSKASDECIWLSEFTSFITDFKTFCRLNSDLNIAFCIFGGILNKIMNPSFVLSDYDIDIFLFNTRNYTHNRTHIEFNKLTAFISRLTESNILNELYDTGSLESGNAEYTTLRHYSRLVNRPGLQNLKHYKGKIYFNKIGYIDIDIITGYPNTTGVDCNISNLYYDPFKEEIKQFKPSNNLVNTIMEIRHKKCTLMLPRELIGIKNINQIILLQSRQHKYLLQGWKIQNIFNFPEPKLDWECAICYEKNAKNTNRKDIITLQCDHSYCKECLIEMSNSKECPTKDNCPLCRKLITTKIVDSSNEPINYNDYPRII